MKMVLWLTMQLHGYLTLFYCQTHHQGCGLWFFEAGCLSVKRARSTGMKIILGHPGNFQGFESLEYTSVVYFETGCICFVDVIKMP